eukprot:3451211-Pleurochrysis_carterae.AAC.1
MGTSSHGLESSEAESEHLQRWGCKAMNLNVAATLKMLAILPKTHTFAAGARRTGVRLRPERGSERAARPASRPCTPVEEGTSTHLKQRNETRRR